MVKILLLTVITVSILQAVETRQEKSLRLQLEAAQAALVEKKQEMTALQKAQLATEEQLKKVNASVRNQTEVLSDKADATRTSAGKASQTQTQTNTKAIEASSDAAAIAARNAQGAADTANASTRNLIIIQAFTLATLFVGYVFNFIYKWFQNRWDRQLRDHNEEMAEKHRIETDGVLHQIHTLVNSNMTEAKKGELDSRRTNLVLLNASVAANHQAGIEPTPDILGVIEATKTKIAALDAELKDRAIAQAEADFQIKAAQIHESAV